mmetsp:Transcript_6763/g.17313  ORF Transcript_6763/g.17313 Transcript_6763/m.17313 type:complete len:246 (-) Transcript_6763:952-1689(-)
MLSRTVLLRIQACCATYATRPDTCREPAVWGTKALMADSREDLPHPTRPMIMLRDPGAKSKLKSFSSNGACCGSSASTATSSAAGAAASLASPPFLAAASAGAFFLVASSAAAFLTEGQRKEASDTLTRPGSDMSGGTSGLSSWIRNAPRRSTALSALSSVVSRKGTRMSGKRSMLKSARAVYAVDAVSVLPASVKLPREHTAMNTGVENSATPNSAPVFWLSQMSATSSARMVLTRAAKARSQA